MKCYHHIDTPAIGVCSDCGRPICKECTGEDGVIRCPECLEAEGAARPTRSRQAADPRNPRAEAPQRDNPFWGWFLIGLGIILQLNMLRIPAFALLGRMLPLILIVVALKLILGGSHRLMRGCCSSVCERPAKSPGPRHRLSSSTKEGCNGPERLTNP